MTVKALLCPKCSRALAGLRYDRVFFCGTCNLAFDLLSPEGIIAYRIAVAAPADPNEKPRFYLPLWRLAIEYTATTTCRAQETALQRMPDLKYIWVNGFNFARPSYYGDLGLIYTEKLIEPVQAEKFERGRWVTGCVRSEEEAANYAKLYVSLILDKKADITGMEIEVKVLTPMLWAIPFGEAGDKLIDQVSGAELPVFALDDVEDIRRINRDR